MDENFILCKILGGSRSYGLENENSDWDYRGVFLNAELNNILGLDKYEHQEFTKDQDVKFKELRHFLNLLKSSNTEAMEIMFAEDFIEKHPIFEELQKYKYDLLDTDRAFSCLKGYMQGELRLANGQRTGALGGKRKESIDKYGFSYKNFVQLFRLAWAGTILFKKGIFPVKVKNYDPAFSEELLDIKNNPGGYTKDQLNEKARIWELLLVEAYENKSYNFKFNRDIANKFILKSYYPLLKEMYEKL